MTHKLSGTPARSPKTKPKYGIIQSGFNKAKKLRAKDPPLGRSVLTIPTNFPFVKTIEILGSLLLAQKK